MTLSGDFIFISAVEREFKNDDGSARKVTQLNVQDDQGRIQSFFVNFPFPDHLMGDMIQLVFSVYKKDNAYRVSCVNFSDTI